MEYLYFFNEFYYKGALVGFLLSLSVFLIKYLCKTFPSFPLFAVIRLNIIRYYATKVEKFGFKVLVYLSWIDGHKVKIKDAQNDLKYEIKDPLIFDHHDFKHLPFKISQGFVFYNKKDNSVKGYFHRINTSSKEVYTAKLIATDMDK